MALAALAGNWGLLSAELCTTSAIAERLSKALGVSIAEAGQLSLGEVRERLAAILEAAPAMPGETDDVLTDGERLILQAVPRDRYAKVEEIAEAAGYLDTGSVKHALRPRHALRLRGFVVHREPRGGYRRLR